MTAGPVLAGVDAAPGGWAVVSGPAAGPLAVCRIGRLAALEALLPPTALIGIDIPIGLPTVSTTGGRACERAARRRLGPRRGTSVFSTPPRAVLDAIDYPHALKLARANSEGGRGLSKQCWYLLPPMAEALAFTPPGRREHVFEVHPEASFAAMAGQPLLLSKHRAEGRTLRLEVLAGADVPAADLTDAARATRLPLADVLDAAAVWWTVRRIAAGEAETLPEEAVEHDPEGRAMRIHV